jgi:hypothetical protein
MLRYVKPAQTARKGWTELFLSSCAFTVLQCTVNEEFRIDVHPLQQLLKMPPKPAPAATGTKRALLVGCNYPGEISWMFRLCVGSVYLPVLAMR